MNLETGDVIAIKEFRFQNAVSFKQLKKSVQEEMNVFKLLRHANIIEYYGTELHRDKLYIFMEFCPSSLETLVRENVKLTDLRHIRVILRQILEGLVFLHDKGLIHR